jgi:hypothetical protein
MARLNHLGRLAEEKGQYGVAGRMEELRGKVAGYYIDRQIIKQKGNLEDLSEEELNERISKIAEDYGHLLEPDKKKKEKKNGKTEE